MSKEALLQIRNVTMQFGGLTAIRDVSFDVEEGKIIGVIGPNGAGKTTLFNMLTGIYVPTEGDILFEGKSICKKSTHEITELGIARTFQNIRLFNNMTVLDNVMIGCHCRYKSTVLESILHLPRHKKTDREMEQEAMELLEIVGLADYRYEYANSLAYGLQRRLEIARALATRPRILLLDEPAAGMNEKETQELTEFIREVRGMGHTIILIEHDVRLVMGLCDYVNVLDHGALIASGVADEVQKNPLVIEAYLGKGVEE